MTPYNLPTVTSYDVYLKEGRRLSKRGNELRTDVIDWYVELGQWAVQAKEKVQHGEFMPLYKAAGFGKDEIDRAQQIFRAWPQIKNDAQGAGVGDAVMLARRANRETRSIDKAMLEIDARKTEIEALRAKKSDLETRHAELDARMPDAYKKACDATGKEEIDKRTAELRALLGERRACEAAMLEDARELTELKNQANNDRRQSKKLHRQMDSLKIEKQTLERHLNGP